MTKKSETPDPLINKFQNQALKLGAISAKVIPPKSIITGSWVRWKCQFGCGAYGSSLVCPPFTPTPKETRKILDEYNTAILFEATRYDTKKIACELEKIIFLFGYYKALGLGAGPCRLCRKCSFNKGCRHPDKSRPSMEACGIDVFKTVREHGFKINVAKNTSDKTHYFGLVLIE